jgi:hypothetical protein
MGRGVRWTILTVAGVSLIAAACNHKVNVKVINKPGGLGSTTQSEPHIAAWGNVVVASWNDFDNGQHRFPKTAYASSDGGQNWADPLDLNSVNTPTIYPTGDSVLAVHGSGTFYLATMAHDADGNNYIGVARSIRTTPRVEFGPLVLVAGADLTASQDKPWMAVDESSGRVYLCWTEITASGGRIRFIRSESTDPLTFGLAPAQIAPSSFGTGVSYFGRDQSGNPTSKLVSTSGKGCNIAVGPGGEIYVAWITKMGTAQQAIRIRKSVNGGESFEDPVDGVVVAEPEPSGDTQATNDCTDPEGGVFRALSDGHIRIPDWPLIAVDRSETPSKGTVYIAFSGAGGAGDEADVFVVRSPDPANPDLLGRDPGFSWSPARAINKAPAAVEGVDATNNDNWLPAIAVASDGTVAVSYYDRRSDQSEQSNQAHKKINVYLARSKDGEEWRNEQVTPTPFGVPPLQPDNFDFNAPVCYMGDYNGITAVETVFHLVWGDNSNTVQDRPDPDIAYRKIP